MLTTFTLKNGIKVASYRMRSLRSIHLKINVKGGSILEKKGKTGCAHFLEHMLIQGIPSLPNAESMAEYIENLAGNYNASTGEFTINFMITLPATHLEDAIKIASEVFFEPLFPEPALERERRAILEEVKQRMDSQDYKLGKFARVTRFKKGSILCNSVGGSLKDISRITKADITEFWKEIFTPGNTYISITGNFQNSKLKHYLEKYFLTFVNIQYKKIPQFSENELSTRQVALRHDNKMKSNYIDLSFSSLKLEDPLILRLRQSLILALLTNLSNSRMFRLLRHQKGLVYGVNAGSYIINGLGYTGIGSETSKENLEEVISLIIQELSTFAKNGPTEEELTTTKNFVENQWLMAFDHPTSISSWIEGDLIWEDKIRLPEEMIELLKSTTVEDLITLTQKHWDFKKANLVIQGNLKNTRENLDKFTEILNKLSY